jgi:hypothetical protein
MQINANKIAFFYYRLFFRIEIFQWVTGDSNKKFRRAGSALSARWTRRLRFPCSIVVSRLAILRA